MDFLTGIRAAFKLTQARVGEVVEQFTLSNEEQTTLTNAEANRKNKDLPSMQSAAKIMSGIAIAQIACVGAMILFKKELSRWSIFKMLVPTYALIELSLTLTAQAKFYEKEKAKVLCVPDQDRAASENITTMYAKARTNMLVDMVRASMTLPLYQRFICPLISPWIPPQAPSTSLY